MRCWLEWLPVVQWQPLVPLQQRDATVRVKETACERLARLAVQREEQPRLQVVQQAAHTGTNRVRPKGEGRGGSHEP